MGGRALLLEPKGFHQDLSMDAVTLRSGGEDEGGNAVAVGEGKSPELLLDRRRRMRSERDGSGVVAAAGGVACGEGDDDKSR